MTREQAIPCVLYVEIPDDELDLHPEIARDQANDALDCYGMRIALEEKK